MTMPKFFAPRFIGALIKMAKQQPRYSPLWFGLWLAVEQCRTYNDGDQPAREAVWPQMVWLRGQLRKSGVMVG